MTVEADDGGGDDGGGEVSMAERRQQHGRGELDGRGEDGRGEVTVVGDGSSGSVAEAAIALKRERRRW